jgi:hypothetical protein
MCRRFLRASAARGTNRYSVPHMLSVATAITVPTASHSSRYSPKV